MGEVDQVEESAQVFENKKDDLEDQIRNLDWILESNVLRCESIERERSHMISEVAEKRERIGIIREDLADFFSRLWSHNLWLKINRPTWITVYLKSILWNRL